MRKYIGRILIIIIAVLGIYVIGWMYLFRYSGQKMLIFTCIRNQQILEVRKFDFDQIRKIGMVEKHHWIDDCYQYIFNFLYSDLSFAVGMMTADVVTIKPKIVEKLLSAIKDDTKYWFIYRFGEIRAYEYQLFGSSSDVIVISVD